MFSLLNFTLLAAANTDSRLFTGLPVIFGVPSEFLLPVVLAILAMVAGYYYGQSIRMNDHGWRVGLIAASFLASLAVVLFWEYKLGVDLKGGAILVYEVNERETAANHPKGLANDWSMDELLQVLNRRLNPDGLKDIVVRPFGPKQVEIVVPEVDEDEVNLLKDRIIEAGVLRFLILADSETRDRTLWDAAKSQILDAQKQSDRLSRNVKDPTDAKGERIIGVWCELDRKRGPGQVSEADGPLPFTAEGAVFNTLLRNGETGEIIMDPTQPPPDAQEFRNNAVQYFHRRNIKKVEVLMAADPEIDIRGSDLATANEGYDDTGSPAILFTMKGDGASKMGEITTANRPTGNGATTRKLGIIWDNRLVSAPSIQSTISTRGQITGFTMKEVREKVQLLRSGSMPVVLYPEPISDNRIGATLGLDTVRKGSMAIMISLVIVFGFVMIYYRTAGFIACFALLLNMLLTVAIMFALKAPFTLPGLAGLVLTVGMSVDANVLIYERIREELERGAALRMAIRNGFDKALVTIIDSNVTTLLTAVILYVIGTDQVRGFGMTLILGIVTSMFTAIFCSRAILEIGERAYRWTTLSMLKFFSHMNIDWMSTLRPAAVISIVLIIAGLAATIYRGRGIFDIDMAGGSTVQFILDTQVYPSITETDVRKRLDVAAEGVIDPKTKNKAVLNTYQTFVGTPGVGTAASTQQIWKVDCSLEDVEQLKQLVRKAFRTADDREGLQTYGLSLSEVKEILPEKPADRPAPPNTEFPPAFPPAVPPKTGELKPTPPTSDTPKPESAKPESTEPAKPETPKSDTPKPEAPKDEPPPKKDAKEDSADCQPAEETKKEETKKDEPAAGEAKKDNQPEAKPEPAKPTDSKPDEPKPGEPKTEEPKTPATPPTTVEPPTTPENDPSKLIPPLPPLGQIKPKTLVDNVIKSVVHLKLDNTKITGSALQDRIQKAATKAIGQASLADVSTPGWNRVDNKSFSEWDVTLSLPKEEAAKVLAQLEKDLSSEPVWQTSSGIGGQVSGKTRARAFWAIVGSIIGMILYMWVRFHKVSWGIAAAVALAHDALVMLGAIAMSYFVADYLGFLQVEQFKISLPVVAAFLTLIGYSINDTIVIFDRIREIRGKSPEVTGQMINDAVNQTLSRTFLTAGTTLVVIVILYFLGGSGIHAFAFSLVVGVISGTYSTVFIASPLLLYLIQLDQQQTTGKNISVPASEKTRGAA